MKLPNLFRSQEKGFVTLQVRALGFCARELAVKLFDLGLRIGLLLRSSRQLRFRVIRKRWNLTESSYLSLHRSQPEDLPVYAAYAAELSLLNRFFFNLLFE